MSAKAVNSTGQKIPTKLSLSELYLNLAALTILASPYLITFPAQAAGVLACHRVGGCHNFTISGTLKPPGQNQLVPAASLKMTGDGSANPGTYLVALIDRSSPNAPGQIVQSFTFNSMPATSGTTVLLNGTVGSSFCSSRMISQSLEVRFRSNKGESVVSNAISLTQFRGANVFKCDSNGGHEANNPSIMPIVRSVGSDASNFYVEFTADPAAVTYEVYLGCSDNFTPVAVPASGMTIIPEVGGLTFQAVIPGTTIWQMGLSCAYLDAAVSGVESH